MLLFFGRKDTNNFGISESSFLKEVLAKLEKCIKNRYEIFSDKKVAKRI
jgi:hypothetical protein